MKKPTAFNNPGKIYNATLYISVYKKISLDLINKTHKENTREKKVANKNTAPIPLRLLYFDKIYLSK